MHREAPKFQRCCFCLPLRRGLIAWGYIKLLLNILVIINISCMIFWSAFRPFNRFELREIIILASIDICLLVDVSFNIVFVVAGHKKSVKLLRISFLYSIVWLGLVALFICYQIYVSLYHAYRFWEYLSYRPFCIFHLASTLAMGLSLISVQIYLVLLIRSEVIKLRQQSLEMQFTNHAALGEAQCTLYNKPNTGKCTDETRDVQDCTDEKRVLQCCTDGKQAVQGFCTDKNLSV